MYQMKLIISKVIKLLQHMIMLNLIFIIVPMDIKCIINHFYVLNHVLIALNQQMINVVIVMNATVLIIILLIMKGKTVILLVKVKIE